MSVFSKPFSVNQSRVLGNTFSLPVFGSLFPPVKDKLLIWLPGTNADSSHKLDKINGYNFSFVNCPPQYEYSDGFVDVSDGTSDWDGASYRDSKWECTYSAPAVGESGHDELLSVDDGTFYDINGDPISHDQGDFLNLNSTQFFFCSNFNKGLVIYNQPLTGDELTEVQNWVSCNYIDSDITLYSGDNGGYLIGYRSERVNDIYFGSISPEYTPEGDFLSNLQINTSTNLIVLQFEGGGYAGFDDVTFRINDGKEYTASWNAANNRYEATGDPDVIDSLGTGKISYIYFISMLPQRSNLLADDGSVLATDDGVNLTGV